MNLRLSYTNATILHSNKYNQRIGMIIGWFVFNNLHQDIVFKLDNTGEEISATFNNINSPLYLGQNVTLVSADDKVIAYIDRNSGNYYYLSNNLIQDLGYGWQFSWGYVFAITLLLFVVLAQLPENISSYAMLAFLLPLGFRIYRFVGNFFLERKIDRLITSG